MVQQVKSLSSFGLIGRCLDHSWSPAYFTAKFAREKIDADYQTIEIESLDQETYNRVSELYAGLNVTVPYKETIIPYLDYLSPIAEIVGAVNCISREKGKWVGHNTDIIGFRESLRPRLKSWHSKALILGTGGASKAVAHVLKELGIEYRFVSRHPSNDQYGYNDLNAKAMEIFPFIINCTPLGMHPHISDFPPIPYDGLTEKNFLYDLVYNPVETQFLQKGKLKRSQICNGVQMLRAQAEAAWAIWQGDSGNPANQ